MKKVLTLILLLHFGWVFGQSNEQSEANSEITSVTYVELNNDVMSSSNISLGYLGEFTMFSFNLAYEWESGKHTNGVFYSHTPSFKYNKVGYTYGRLKEFSGGLKRMTNYSLTLSNSGYTPSTISISPYFNQMYQKKSIRLGYTFFVNDYSWDDFENDNQFYDAAVNQNYSLMLIGMKEWEFKHWVLRPEVFLLTDIRTHYFTLYEDAVEPLDIWYWNDFNINLYYGTSLEYKVTDVFSFGTKLRSSFDYDVSDINLGYQKATPYFVTLGANYDF